MENVIVARKKASVMKAKEIVKMMVIARKG